MRESHRDRFPVLRIALFFAAGLVLITAMRIDRPALALVAAGIGALSLLLRFARRW